MDSPLPRGSSLESGSAEAGKYLRPPARLPVVKRCSLKCVMAEAVAWGVREACYTGSAFSCIVADECAVPLSVQGHIKFF